MTRVEKLLLQLIKINSFSGQEEEIGEFIVKKLKNFKIKKQKIGKNRFNIIARKGNSKNWIVCHMDTVASDLPARITADKIFGRGACDNKGNIAGAIMAGNQMKEINLLFTCGEEKDLIGARKAKISGEKIIVMEPTDFRIINRQNGAITFSIETFGQEKHSSQMKKADESATNQLVGTLNNLMKKQWIAMNCWVVDGGKAENIVAGKAKAIVSIRPKNMKEHQRVVTHLNKIRNNKKIKIQIINLFKPYANSKIKGEQVPYFTEMFFFKNSFLFGAGSIKQAHSANEFISRKKLNALPEKIMEIFSK